MATSMFQVCSLPSHLLQRLRTSSVNRPAAVVGTAETVVAGSDEAVGAVEVDSAAGRQVEPGAAEGNCLLSPRSLRQVYLLLHCSHLQQPKDTQCSDTQSGA